MADGVSDSEADDAEKEKANTEAEHGPEAKR